MLYQLSYPATGVGSYEEQSVFGKGIFNLKARE